MRRPLVSILIPHYQTPNLARLCLRSIRRYTKHVPYEVLVIDNGSRDADSIDYLRSVAWIRLIERGDAASAGAAGHKEAIELGIQATVAPLILTFHTDTIPIRDDWLAWHVLQIEQDPQIAAVGTYKLERKSWWRRMLKSAGQRMPRQSKKGGDDDPYIRSHCALYRRSVLEQLNLNYNNPDDQTAGRHVHRTLEANGYVARRLSVDETLSRVVHLNHATMVLVSEFETGRRTRRRGRRRIEQFLSRESIQEILADTSLDGGGAADVPHAA